ncbi:hypothetical protein BRARA_I01419 [Brassica rapa]|uniref:Transmembrane protein n=1 Tax=Brassica campestris TaxID=3711 RepID=A0A397XU98_BRACM|nr:hypothetical protein BRARA_I01419 [Brassica rapa]
MEIIWRTTLSTLMLFFFLRYFDNPPTPPNPLLFFFFLSLILFLFIIHSNRFVNKEAQDFNVLCTSEEDSTTLDNYTIDKNKDCCSLTKYCYDYSQWNEDDSDDGIENHDDDDREQGDDDDDTLTNRIEDYIARVYNGWRADKLFV